MPNGDVTARLTIPENQISTGQLVVKENLVLCGIELFKRTFELLNSDNFSVEIFANDGEHLRTGSTIATLRGKSRTMLAGERVALNLLQRLSGIATLTERYLQEVDGTNCKIADTRKTTPGLRAFEKYAVVTAGGTNHRYSLSDAILIKENHIKAGGGIESVLKKVFESKPHLMDVEIEVENLGELQIAINAGAKNIMLDNFTPEKCKEAVEYCKGKGIYLEASGNMNLQTIRSYAETGIDIISIGKLTHSAPAADISLLIE